MSFKQKNTLVMLVNFSLLLLYVSFRVWQMVQTDTFINENVFSMFGVVVVWAIIGTIVAVILSHLVPLIIKAAKIGKDKVEIDDLEDERDKLIDMRGTQVTYTAASLGSLIAMLTFVFGQPPLVMFCLLLFFGVLAQVIGDATRLMLYRGRL
ncbi:MAG: hypothetical protein KC708_08420 [Anaerolineae bacterium]|nr:hypothetical protein [Anaerolineae bacterium]